MRYWRKMNKIFLFLALMLPGELWAVTGRLFTSDMLSSGLITCVCQDHEGYLWVGTEYGLNKFDGYRFTRYLHQKNDSTSIVNNEISSLFVDDSGTLWVGCSEGLCSYDAQHNRFRRYAFPHNRRPRVSSMLQAPKGTLMVGTAGYGLYTIAKGQDMLEDAEQFNKVESYFYSRIFIDREGCFWRSSHLQSITRFMVKNHKVQGMQKYESPFGQPRSYINYSAEKMLIVCMYGIMTFDYKTDQLSKDDYDVSLLGGSSIKNAFMDGSHNIYVGTSGGGLMVIRNGQRKLERVVSSNSLVDLATTQAVDVIEDREQNLWVGCYNKGLLLLNGRHQAFSSWTFSEQGFRTGGSVSSIVIDGDMTWCTLQPGGVYGFDRHGKVVTHPATPFDVRTIHRDVKGRYWLGTQTELYRYFPESGRAEAVSQFYGRGINSIASDRQGTLYVSDYGLGLCIFNPETGEKEKLDMSQTRRKGGSLSNNWIQSMTMDREGNLWIAMASGINMMRTKDRNFNAHGWKYLLGGITCYAICQMKNGDMMIGTNNGLYIYHQKTHKVEQVKGVEPLNDKLISALVADPKSGYVWISTTQGIWEYHPEDGKLLAHVGGNGLTSKEYTLGTGVYHNGRIYFGTPDGITVFRPEDVANIQQVTGNVRLTRITINGNPMSQVASTYNLKSNENNITLEFSVLDYINAGSIAYEWRVDGSNDWQQTDEGQNVVTLNQLQPGNYDIEVRALSNGQVSENTLHLHIIVNKPWYRSVWAYLFYLLLAAAFVGLILYNFERQRRRDLEESKMRFLINATHDIRSPLTLIMAALEKLKAEGRRLTKSSDQREDDPEPGNLSAQDELMQVNRNLLSPIETIDRNAQRLLLLVNQILDERKIDKGQMRLQCRETNLGDFIGGILKLYEYNAQQRNITLRFEKPEMPLMVWIDRIQFDKVVSNLLSNAFKYSHDGGEIVIGLISTDREAIIMVMDNGMGFESDKTDRFFERFYQGGVGSNQVNGTGIGLNLSRAITEMHHGKITAANRKDGQTGAVLTVTLPLGKDHLKPDEIEEKEEAGKADSEGRTNGKKSKASKNLQVLIVDDDPEIARYISEELSKWYRFSYARNGREGLKQLLSQDFDLVISDVMMPEMDGLSLLRAVKSNSNISHIPVILLTSKSEVAYRLEGLKKGADAYLSKPFSMEELHVQIDNLVDNVRRLRGKFSGQQGPGAMVDSVRVKGNNDVLMEKIMKSINEHLSDPDLNMDLLTQEVGISRAQLHRKMKEITGISTSEFIRNLRLEQAARLIKEKKINITQVAYSVGFNNQTHFSTVFKKHFGITPTEYAES